MSYSARRPTAKARDAMVGTPWVVPMPAFYPRVEAVISRSVNEFNGTGNPDAADSRAARQSRTDQRPSSPVQKAGV